MSTPSPLSASKILDQTVTRDKNKCTAHTHTPWKSRHKHGWWPDGLRSWAMWGLVAVIVGVLVTALVFAIDAGLRSAGVMSYAGARGGPSGYDEHGPVAERTPDPGELG
ncbi:hypothetical protein BR93DRAFT_968680 [Coniochaeta sp. PMI_546]|nr:hypothetical protein BR93DRAFT_968680 [Coniochaeta sp. PMI_546]